MSEHNSQGTVQDGRAEEEGLQGREGGQGCWQREPLVQRLAGNASDGEAGCRGRSQYLQRD